MPSVTQTVSRLIMVFIRFWETSSSVTTAFFDSARTVRFLFRISVVAASFPPVVFNYLKLLE